MDTFNGRYMIQRIQNVEIGVGGIGVDDFLMILILMISMMEMVI